MVATGSPQTLQDAILFYADRDVCQQALVAARWPDGVVCPHCGSRDVTYLANQRRWQCKTKHDRRQFSVKVGTIFEDSPIGLNKWFVAIWLIANCKNGVSSYELHRAIGVTQKTAWFMLHRIRLAMQTKSFSKFTGEVEVDETYIGGKASNMHKERAALVKKQGPRWAGKTAVMGLLERHGPDRSHSIVRTRIIKGTKRKELFGIMKEEIAPKTDVFTDALPSYASLNHVFNHQFIDHSERYAEGRVHTNGLENFWSLVKRSIKGTYIAVEPMHLFRYIDEQAFRFNARKGTDAIRFADITTRVSGRRLTYKMLIGHLDDAGQTA
jgi:transposase-like protein